MTPDSVSADPTDEQAPAHRAPRAGRNLPVAIGVGLGLVFVLGLSLFFRPEPFVALATIAVGAAMWELAQAFSRHGLNLPLVPLEAGVVAILWSSFYSGSEALLVSFVLTVAASAAWRVVDETGLSAVRDAAAATFAAAYLPFLAGFVVLVLASPDGQERTLILILLAVASDTGGYIAGVLFGKHPLAPSVSPKKSWEGLAGSFVLAVAVGVVGVYFLLSGPVWLGVALGLVVPLTATIGDLAESMIKRDLNLKDMGSLLPGHGGVLDRIDSMLLTAPLVYIAFSLFL